MVLSEGLLTKTNDAGEKEEMTESEKDFDRSNKMAAMGIYDELEFLEKKPGKSRFFNPMTKSIVDQIKQVDVEEAYRIDKLNRNQNKYADRLHETRMSKINRVSIQGING